MQNRFIIPTLLVFLLILPQACTRTPCINATFNFGLIGFTDTAAETIIMRRYAKNHQFTVLIDTSQIHPGFTRHHDTLELSSFSATQPLYSTYDYEFYFPAANKSFRLAEIQEEYNEIRHSIFSNVKVGCENAISRLTINNQAVYPPAYNYFYLSY